ncbi:YIP1 family protein [Paenibacillus sp. GXUN7292]|uniref:YIP1 family protein n=1 Tax=Paenibacillus sp. GXUN7292 TaxID=3422499 RepID=UPI003D7D6414
MSFWRKVVLLFSILLLLPSLTSVLSAVPYEGYNYSWRGTPEPAPVPYVFEARLTGEQLGVGGFRNPEDMVITSDNRIYVLDSGNNRIVQVGADFHVERVIDSFTAHGVLDHFATPQGLFVAQNGHLYVADTGNKRIVELTAAGEFVRAIGQPEADILPANFVYQPIKLTVDSAGRPYVIAKGVFDGIMQFDAGGTFTGFMGVNKVQFSLADLFWKRMMTKEQRSKMVLFVPIEFNHVAIDEDGFIFATSAEQSEEPVKRLNPSGIDVLKRSGYWPPMGDKIYSFTGTRSDPSSIHYVTPDKNGIYSILDQTRGRIFTYDRDGNLMYTFARFGEQQGTFKSPSAVAMLGDRMAVLDKGMNHISLFKPTLYGQAVRSAVIHTDEGDSDLAVEAWHQALELNNNLELAYIGIGKAELRRGNYIEAMQYFKQGMHQEYYSRAFAHYRKEYMWDNFGTILASLAAIVILLIAVRKIVRKRAGEPQAVGMAWYTMFHPFKGFWELKYENKGRVWFSLVLVFLLAFLYVIKHQYNGFLLNPIPPVYVLGQAKFVLIPFFLWCVANWSLTTLMDGEGKFKEIVVAGAYALCPLILVQVPLIILSNTLTIPELPFYNLLEAVAWLWFLGLLFVGMLTIHQYTVGKTIVTSFLTLIVIGIILFLALLFFSLLQQTLSLGTTIFKEIIFRIGE